MPLITGLLVVFIAALGSCKCPILVWINTLGFVLYGLFLLRNRRVRSDGG